MKPVHSPVNRTAPQRCQLPYAALRAAQPFTTVHFSNDQGPEIRSSFPLQEDSSSSEVGEAMPCATCQNRSSPCCCVCSREFSNNTSVTISMPPCAGMAPFLCSLPHPSPPEEDFCAQVSLYSHSSLSKHPSQPILQSKE